jgi:acyl transferase domain-containing protein/acyl carrier protein
VSQVQEAILALRRLRARLEAVEQARSEPVAVVGIGCRFPGGGHGPEPFWRLLREGVDAVAEVPAERWDVDACYDPEPGRQGKTYCRWGGFLAEVDRFDARFFGIAPKEAVSMDPQQRLVLETAWEALEHAALAPAGLAGSATGVYLGISTSDYLQLGLWSGDPARIDPYAATGGAASVTAGRLSYLLGLRGPSLAVNTACSSSLVALHLACQSLRAGECELALAGGVNLMLSPVPTIALSAMRMLAGDGRCKTFDAAADGFVRGEGCGIVVLRRLSRALAAGDRVIAVVLGSAVNQDGQSGGLTAPNGPAQEALLRAALAAAGVAPADVGYVEAHGTGTPLGDPIEVQALAATFAAPGRPPERPLLVGSVKTNIGHLEAAAGIAGLIKAVLAVERGEVPPHLHLQRLNPRLDLRGAPLRIPTVATPWPAADGRRVAGVSSFGFSGTNAHVVVAQAPATEPGEAAAVERPRHLLCLSARTPAALRELARNHGDRLAAGDSPALADAAFTLNAGRNHFGCRLAVAAAAAGDAVRSLRAFAAGEEAPGLLRGETPGTRRPQLAFLFSGQGAQYAGMGRRLFDTQPSFRRVLERCEEVLQAELGLSLLARLFHGEPGALDRTGITQPALFALEVALATLWRAWGIEPAAVLGHSIGEYAAACVAGLFGLEDGLRLVARRARLMEELPAGGAMAAVFAAEARVAAALAGREDRLSIAAVNGAQDLVLSGDDAALAEVLAELAGEGIRGRRLAVSHAFHSHRMEPALDRLEAAAREVAYGEARIAVMSNLTGLPAAPGEMAVPGYWRRHARRPVRFAAGVDSLRREGCTLFLEIGPGTSLVALGRRAGAPAAEAWLPSLRAGRDEWETVLGALGELYVRGVEVDWAGFDRDYRRRRVALPTYPFERQRYWLDAPPAGERRVASGDGAPAAGPGSAPVAPGLSAGLYELGWQPLAPPLATPGCAAGAWLILGGGELGEALAERLQRLGGSCRRAGGEDGAGVIAAASGLASAAGPWRAVVDLRPAAPEEAAAAFSPAAALARCAGCLQLVQELARLPVPPRLWLVTRAARQVAPAERPALAGGPLRGFARVVAREHPELWGGLVDLPQDLGPGAGAEELALALAQAPAAEDELALRHGRLWGARLRRRPLPAPERSLELRPDASYWIVGGLGSVGLRLARWMAGRGARHLVLTGRREPAGEAADGLARLRAAGLDVAVVPADVAQPASAANALAAVQAPGRPLAGVAHLAGVLADGVLLRQDRELLARAFAPKVDGAWNLHLATRELPLDFFLLFSSSAALLGAAGQAGYAAANSFLDALAGWRRAAGLPALAVAWSAWAGSGMSAGRTAAGMRPLDAEEAFAALDAVLAAALDRSLDTAQLALMALDWERLRAEAAASGARMPGLLSEVAGEAPGARRRGELRQRLARAAPAERLDLLRSCLKDEVAAVLGLPPAAPLPAGEGFFDLGMDSLMALDLRQRLQAGLGDEVALPATLAFDHPTLDDLARHLAERLGLAAGAAPAAAPAALAAGEPIAIIGIGCRFPGGARDPDAFWRLLRDGVDAVAEVPGDRWDVDACFDPDPRAPGKTVSRWGSFLDEVDRFDAEFFGISPREAVAMDPQQRLLLEVGWQAMEDANLVPGGLAERETGVFVGISATEYGGLLTGGGEAARIDAWAGVGNALSAAAGRLSFTLGLRGPSLAIDTACSSSLVAVDQACLNLRAGRCRLALAGGVNLMLTPATQINLSQARMLAPDGRCKTFDAAADGYVRGEGCGMLVLKRLADAQADGDLVHAVLLGSAVNQDGRSAGLTVPNGAAQEAVMRAALAAAGVEPAAVGYVEAHGTGTALGDPIEIRALAAVYGEGRPAERPLVVGSVKTNLGHLEPAAGIAGLIKAVLALEHGEIPPHLHLARPNPHVPWGEIPVAVATQRLPWPGGDGPRIAGVSSFGFVGTNAHVILQQAPPLPAPAAPARHGAAAAPEVHLLALSARDEAALAALAERYRERIAADPELSLADLCHTANRRRSRFAHRLAVAVAGGPAEVCAALAAAREGRAAPGLHRGVAAAEAGEPPAAAVAGVSGGAPSGAAAAADPEQLAELFVRGAAVDLAAPANGAERRLVRVPTYAFGGERYWPEPASPGAAAAAPEPPLLGRRLRAAARETVFETELSGRAPGLLGDHRIGGEVVVPGAYLLARMMAAAAAALPGSGALAIEEVAFHEPLALAPEAAGRSLQVVLDPRQDGAAACRAASLPAGSGEDWTLHASGSVRRLGEAEAEAEAAAAAVSTAAGAAVSTAAVAAVSTAAREAAGEGGPGAAGASRREADRLYEMLERSGVGLGPGFRWLERVRRGAGQAAGELRAPRPDEGPPADPFHPGLLDSCFQLLGAALPDEGGEPDLFLPLGVDRLVLLGRPGSGPARCLARCRQAAGPRPETFTGDLELADAAGRPLLRVEGLQLKRAGRDLAVRQLLAEAVYETAWQPVGAAAAAAVRTWLVLADRGGVGAALAERLLAAGDRCRLALAGDGGGSCRALVEACELPAGAGLGVVHLWGLDEPPGPPDEVDADARELQQEVALGGAIDVTHALLAAAAQRGIDAALWLVTRGAQPVPGSPPVAAGQAPLWGFGATLALEHPELRCVRVDLDPAAPAGTAAADLACELRAGRGEDRVAWRAGVRHGERLVRRAPAAAAVTAEGDATSRLAAGTWLVTGGLGGLGLAVARWLAAGGARHLVLAGRRPAAAAAAALAELRRAGAAPAYVQADVAVESEVARLVAAAERGRPPLRGVIHAAGVIADRVVAGLSWKACAAVLAPKVRGAWNLHRATRGRELQDFVLFSSAAALLGSPGQASYAAANAFLDALASYRHARGLPALSVAWGAWAQVGTVARRGLGARIARRHLGLLAPAAALEVLGRLLRAGSPRLAVMAVDWQRLGAGEEPALWRDLAREARERARRAPPGSSAAGAGAILAVSRDVLRQRLELAPAGERRAVLAAELAAQAGRILGLDPSRPLPPRRPLGELGLDSLMALELRNALGAATGLPLPASLLFDHPTLAELGAHLADRLRLPAGDGATVLPADPGAAAVAAPPAAPAFAAVLAGLSEEALDAVVAEELGRLLEER